MVGRSLKATPAGIEQAGVALTNKVWSREDLAKDVCDPQTVKKFFIGKPVDRKLFVQLCQKLELNWQEISGVKTIASEAKESQASEADNIDALVQQARSHIQPYIQERCGSMKVLDMTQSIELDDIYIHVNILEKVTKIRGLGQAELLQEACLENFDRFRLGTVREKRVPGLKAVEEHQKLMILGKPGAGKTTFLKHLAIGCSTGTFQARRVPIFVTLKEFAEEKGEPDLLTYMGQLPGMSSLQMILDAGRSLILLDGLDEVRDSDSSRVLRDIQQFGDRFRDNQIVITCRIAAKEYAFQRFTEVEVADFDDEQIAEFVKNWFACKQDEVKGGQFIEKLETDEPIRELATSPLLLTLLCSVFEENGSFPANRSELYETGLDVLLKKWDVKRNIQRDEVYKKLSLKRKEDLLSQIAKTTFEAGNYFFKQKEVERQITAYIQNLPDASTDPEALQLDSAAVLKSIEAQHGLFVERAQKIYSFSHLTFHEYFTARKIAMSCNQHAADDPTLQTLVSHITEKRWREVIMLTVGMLESADCLLQMMKRQIDNLLAECEQLQSILHWVQEKAEADLPGEDCFIKSKLRAYYLKLTLNRVTFRLGASIYHSQFESSIRGYAKRFLLKPGSQFDFEFESKSGFESRRLRNHTIKISFKVYAANLMAEGVKKLDWIVGSTEDDFLKDFFDKTLNQKLNLAFEEIPSLDNLTVKEFRDWWKLYGAAWSQKIQATLANHRGLGQDWHFSEIQLEQLQQYYTATKLLVDCLNSECYVSRAVREEIEATLLLPIDSTQK